MSRPVSLIMLQFLAWVAERARTRADVMEAWRSCPHISVWEDSVIEGLVKLEGRGAIALTPLGQTALMASREGAGAAGEPAPASRRAP